LAPPPLRRLLPAPKEPVRRRKSALRRLFGFAERALEFHMF
jgi:hypothetical protein